MSEPPREKTIGLQFLSETQRLLQGWMINIRVVGSQAIRCVFGNSFLPSDCVWSGAALKYMLHNHFSDTLQRFALTSTLTTVKTFAFLITCAAIADHTRVARSCYRHRVGGCICVCAHTYQWLWPEVWSSDCCLSCLWLPEWSLPVPHPPGEFCTRMLPLLLLKRRGSYTIKNIIITDMRKQYSSCCAAVRPASYLYIYIFDNPYHGNQIRYSWCTKKYKQFQRSWDAV